MGVSEPATTAPPELVEFAESYEAAWNGCDTDAMAQLITDDIVWADPALPEPARGIAAVQEFMRSSFETFPDLRFGEPDEPHLSVTGELVAWAWDDARHDARGRRSPRLCSHWAHDACRRCGPV